MARRLTAAREAYDEEATAVARALGISKQTLWGYEKGRTYPDELFLVRFHALTGCPLDWIFLGKITSEMPAEMAARIARSHPDLIALGRARSARETNESA